MTESYIESTLIKKDSKFEKSLRPENLDSFLGQEEIKKRLAIFVAAAKGRREALGHLVFHGPPGLGKTTLAHIIANEMQAKLVTTSGPALEKAGDLAGILTNLDEGDVLFIDEIHRLNKAVEEYLYKAIEDFSLDLMLDSGPNARSVQVGLSHFTLIGATTRMGLLSSPLRSRFHIDLRLDYYSPDILKDIILRSAQLLQISLNKEAAFMIASRSRGSPRIANNLLRWARDYAQIHADNNLSCQATKEALDLLAIDMLGLDEMDKKILSFIIEHHDGGPVGISTIAAALGEQPNTLEEVYEPYLIMQGLLRRTPRGREVTQGAYEHLGFFKGNSCKSAEDALKKKKCYEEKNLFS